MRSAVGISAGVVVFPTAALLVFAAVAAMRHQAPGRWISMAVGAALSLVAIAAIVAASMAMGAIALAISQPRGTASARRRQVIRRECARQLGGSDPNLRTVSKRHVTSDISSGAR
jgi:hypothetical protein